MGQYFIIVNIDKKEYLHPHCLGDGMKLWEIAANGTLNPLALLLRQSTGAGGGDIDLKHDMQHIIDYAEEKLAKAKAQNDVKDIEWYTHTIREYTKRRDEAPDLTKSLIGHWAGDRITIVGDYDESGLQDKAENEYINISHLIIEEFNKFIEIEDNKIYPNDWHTCENYRRTEYIKEQTQNMGRFASAEDRDKNIAETKTRIEQLKALPKEPAYPSQTAHRKKQVKEQKRKAIAPDMVISAGGIQNNPKIGVDQ